MPDLFGVEVGFGIWSHFKTPRPFAVRRRTRSTLLNPGNKNVIIRAGLRKLFICKG